MFSFLPLINNSVTIGISFLLLSNNKKLNPIVTELFIRGRN